MKKTMLFAVCVLALATSAFAQNSVWKVQDDESPVLLKYEGTQGDLTITVSTGATAAVIFTETGKTNTVNFAALTVDGFVAAVNALTGYGSTTNNYIRPWKALKWGAIGTDTLSNLVVAVSATSVTKGEWSTILKWDTSQTKHYNAVVSGIAGDSIIGGRYVTDIFGDVGGTGNLTVTLYEDDTVKFSRTVAEVTGWYYGAATNVVPTSTPGNIPATGFSLGSGVYIGQGKVGFVRAAMSTTATTGGIGAATKQRGE